MPACLAGQSPPRAPTSTVSGTVFDSIAGAALGGAKVQLLGTSGPASNRMLSATADSLGRFRLDSVPFGDYVAGFFHEAIDSLGIDVKSREVRVASNRERIDLGSPSAAQMIGAMCGPESVRDSTAMLIGHVRRADSDQGIVGADVLLEWTETSLQRGRGAVTVERTASAHTIADGWFAICGVPAGFALLTRAAFGGDTTGYVEHESVARGVDHVTFLIGHAERVVIVDSVPADSVKKLRDTVRVVRGTARLAGTVFNNQGAPLAGAQLDIAGTGLVATTNSGGRFTIDSLPSGTRTVSLRAIGFTPIARAVHLAEGRVTTVEFRFPERAVVLGPVEVKAEMIYSRKLSAFESHRRRGVGGVFFQPSPTNGNEHSRIVDLVAQVMNVRTRVTNDGTYAVEMGVRRQACRPSLWLDGLAFRMGFDALNTIIDAGQILGVEVYTHPISMPAEYTTATIGSPCGAIAVWSKPLPTKEKKP